MFLTEVITDMEDDVLFGSFDFVSSEKIHLQLNGYDCDVFVIRNMQNYGEDWSANVSKYDGLIYVNMLKSHILYISNYGRPYVCKLIFVSNCMNSMCGRTIERASLLNVLEIHSTTLNDCRK